MTKEDDGIFKDKKSKGAFFCLGMIFIFMGVILSSTKDATSGTVIIVTGFVFVLLTQFEIKQIKLLGLEAELERKLSEAEQILEKIRGISIPLSSLAVTHAAAQGRWKAAMSPVELYAYVKKIEEQLNDMGVDNEIIRDIKKDWINMMFVFLANKPIDLIYKSLQVKIESENKIITEKVSNDCSIISEPAKEKELIRKRDLFQNESEKLGKLYLADSPDSFYHFNEKLTFFVNNTPALNQDEKNLFWANQRDTLEDISYLLTKGDLRRKEALSSNNY